ncbi:hypothetical protein WJX81_005202 [Elliptochloris bilobata]|uniref:ABC1 atypical kinase-like domain-containing protein n=1 Tax=Elliptochloris bilobata TaxID=381761 RepID=A0AAW1RUM4_9CHLO
MSFFTSKHFEDASRVLRGLLLVATRAAADSSLLRSATKADPGKALQDALSAASRQSSQVAEALQGMARERGMCGAGPTTDGMRQGQHAAQQADEGLAQGLRGALVEGERAQLKQADAVMAERKAEVRRKLRERAVPASPLGRAFGFARLGANLVYGTVSDSVSRYIRGPPAGSQADGDGHASNRYLTEANAERLADALCRMRGAALKLGQMLSIQDENVLPPQLTAALERVRAGADVMPRRQLEKVLVEELGDAWRAKVAVFEDEPLAAASIGQVHGATLHDARRVAMKIQYPGVARSIGSDVDNLLRVISLANVLPKGLYVEAAAKVAKKELALECDYGHEARSQARFRDLINADAGFAGAVNVPDVIWPLCSERVITTEFVPGVHIDKVASMDQGVRDAVGTTLLELSLRELFVWRFMQTDPNWGNFLFDAPSGRLHLIDFGAARDFPKPFVDDYLRMVRACAEQDRDEVILRSKRLGFLTGDESRVMLDAHSEAGFAVGTPFSAEGAYDFSQHGHLTRRVADLGAIMLRHRLTAPPEEAYSLHRKLSGAFLACVKLRACVPCRELFYRVYDRYVFDDPGAEAPASAAAA